MFMQLVAEFSALPEVHLILVIVPSAIPAPVNTPVVISTDVPATPTVKPTETPTVKPT